MPRVGGTEWEVRTCASASYKSQFRFQVEIYIAGFIEKSISRASLNEKLLTCGSYGGVHLI